MLQMKLSWQYHAETLLLRKASQIKQNHETIKRTFRNDK